MDIQDTLLLFDHHVPSGRSLAVLGVTSASERGGDLVLLENLAAGEPAAIARWHLPEWDKPGSKPKVEYARLLDGDLAVVQVNNTIHLWNLTGGASVHKIENIRPGAKIEVSGAGKYLAIPVSFGCVLVDVAKGELIGKVPFPTSLAPEAKFSPKILRPEVSKTVGSSRVQNGAWQDYYPEK